MFAEKCSKIPRALAASAVFQQTKAGNIGDKVGVPSAVRSHLSALAAEVTVFAGEAVGESELIIQDKIEIAKAVDHYRRVGERDEACRLVSLGVEVLAPGVQRRRKHAAFVPFESLLASTFLPDGGGAATFDDVDEFFEEIALWQRLALGGDFADIGVAAPPGAEHVDESARRAFAPPRAELDRS